MANKNTYDEHSIKILEGLEAVRKRPGMYIGSTDKRGMHHLVWEIVDNSIDEIINGFGDYIKIILHKDGSIIGSVFKIMFLVCLFGTSLSTSGDVLGVIGIALLANLLVTAVPIGGGTISEMLIITMMGYPVAALPILTMIATIIDPPATMLNVVGDTVSSMMVTRVVEGKDWNKEDKSENQENKI